jgi:UDP-N-acetylglucosamine--N-acetylmuramyl-(pentapeptide) pyrophosphoryl-undecaprenol N-acetylglucosamine transferase
VKILPFIDRMDLAYAAAGIIVSRAGAIAISELALAGKPVILVPSPNVAEDHQTRNAQALVNKKAARMVRDAEAMDNLAASIRELLDNERLREELQTNIRRFALPDAADRIAQEALEMIKKD